MYRRYGASHVGSNPTRSILEAPLFALVAELVDAPDLGSGPVRGAGSSPARRTKFVKSSLTNNNGQGGTLIAYLSEMVDRERRKNRIRDWYRVRLVNV